MFLDPVTGVERGGIKKVSYTHEALADLILANPAISQNDLAAHFGYTPGWISQVIASDAFQAFISERKDKIVDPLLRGAVEESMKGLVLQSMQRLREKLEANPSDQLVLEVFKNSTRALGYGARVEVHGNINHSHSLMGVLQNLPTEKVVNPLIQAPTPA
jgi:hypothetical protein